MVVDIETMITDQLEVADLGTTEIDLLIARMMAGPGSTSVRYLSIY